MAKEQLTIQDCEKGLQIDDTRIDDCLEEQTELFYAAAKNHANAESEYDALKYEFELSYAKYDLKERDLAFRRDEKTTEKLLDHRISLLPVMQELNKQLLAAKRKVRDWDAIKDAYGKRGFMLNKLVDWKLGELQSLSIERGSSSKQREGYSNHAKKLRRG